MAKLFRTQAVRQLGRVRQWLDWGRNVMRPVSTWERHRAEQCGVAPRLDPENDPAALVVLLRVLDMSIDQLTEIRRAAQERLDALEQGDPQ